GAREVKSLMAGVAIASTVWLSVRGGGDLQRPSPAATAPAKKATVPIKSPVPFDDAAPILAALPNLPAGLKDKTAPELRAAWPAWVARHDAEIRARLYRGDEDSVVNFWLYGTTFTSLPRATEQDLAKLNG